MSKLKSVLVIGGCVLLIIAAGIAAAAIMFWPGKQKEKQAESETGESQTETSSASAEGGLRAMYVPIADEAYIFVDQDNGSVFTVSFPEEIYNISGEKITQADLKKGNIVEIYGNGIMLESYPGQYPGVESIKVVSEGQPSDADAYRSIVDAIYQPPDPSQPPSLNVEYRTKDAAVTLMAVRCGYEWHYTKEDGSKEAITVDIAHILQMKDIVDAALREPTDLTLVFSEKPDKVTAVRWEAGLLGMEGDVPDGEAVAVLADGDQFVIPLAEAGYVYFITGIWGESDVSYGFMTVSV